MEEGYNQDRGGMDTQEEEITSDESYLNSQENLEEDIHERMKSLRIGGKRKELAISDSQREIEELKALVRQQAQQLSFQVPQSDPFHSRPKEAKPINVTVFDGDADKLSQFFTDLRILFTQRKSTYEFDDEAKIFALYGYCSDKVKSFLQPVIEGERSDISCSIFEEVKQALFQQYHDPQIYNNRAQQFAELRQTTSVEELVEPFERLARQLNYPIGTWGAMFKAKLNYNIQDPIDNLALDLIDYYVVKKHSLSIDRNIRTKMNRNRGLANTSKRLNSSSITTNTTSFNAKNRKFSGPLTEEEKQRRREHNLCNYCGGEGHKVVNCPIKPKRQVTLAATAVSTELTEPITESKVSQSPLLPETTLTLASNFASETANHTVVQGLLDGEEARMMVDSGATANFVDEAWVKSKGLSCVPIANIV